MAGERGEVPNLPVSALLDRYRNEVAKHKKGAKWECIRLEAMGRDRLASVRLRTLDAPHVSDWQKRRLEAVSEASVRRERNLINHVFEIARKEWRWLSRNPFDGVRRPKDSKPRDRIATDKEIALLSEGGELGRVVVFALETGMRASEIASNPKVYGKVAILGDSKTGDGRAVPLSAKAIEAYGEGFTLTAGSISTLFARRCKELGIEGLTFHDLRHTAATRLSKKLDVWELAKMFGWKDLKIPLNTYYKSDPEETAKKL
jgi:integrase